MRTLLVPAVLAAGLVLGSSAFAATTAPPRPSTATASPKSATSQGVAAKAQVAHQGKQQACEANWKDQKTHNGTHGAFMKACVAKG